MRSTLPGVLSTAVQRILDNDDSAMDAVISHLVAHGKRYPHRFYVAAHRLHDAGRFQEADKVYRTATAICKTDPSLWYSYGVFLRDTGDANGAVPVLRQAVDLDSSDAEIRYALANALRDVGEVNEAVGAYRSAIVLNPMLVMAYNNLGILLRKLDNNEEALQVLRRGRTHGPNDPQLLHNLALSEVSCGDKEFGLRLFRYLIGSPEASAALLADYGTALCSSGRTSEAALVFARAEAHCDHEYLHLLWNRAVCLENQALYQDALSDLERIPHGSTLEDRTQVEEWKQRLRDCCNEPDIGLAQQEQELTAIPP